MKMNYEDKLKVNKALLEILSREINKLDDPYADELPLFIHRAMMAKLRMKSFAMAHGEPPEMSIQIDQMDGIIKKLQDLQNKKCY